MKSSHTGRASAGNAAVNTDDASSTRASARAGAFDAAQRAPAR
jgi:hypothetical protein